MKAMKTFPLLKHHRAVNIFVFLSGWTMCTIKLVVLACKKKILKILDLYFPQVQAEKTRTKDLNGKLKIHRSNQKKKKKKQCRKSQLRKVGSSYITEPISKKNLHLDAFYDW